MDKITIQRGDYIILPESVPAGTTQLYATAKALGYNVDGLFTVASEMHQLLKRKLVNRAIENIDLDGDI